MTNNNNADPTGKGTGNATYDAEQAAHAIAARMGGGVKVEADGVFKTRCPVHGNANSDLNLQVSDWRGKLSVKCWSRDCDKDAIKAKIAELMGGARYRSAKTGHARQDDAARRAAARHAMAQTLARSEPIEGTVVEAYLSGRGLMRPLAGHHLRFLPGTPYPAMVGIITDLRDANTVLSLHTTYLAKDGSGKAPIDTPKRYFKDLPKKGGVIRLGGEDWLKGEIGIAEGIETALAVMTSYSHIPRIVPVFAGLDAGNIGGLQIMPNVNRITVYADKGEAGEKAAAKLARCWHAGGCEVFVCTAPVDDWNPTLKEAPR